MSNPINRENKLQAVLKTSTLEMVPFSHILSVFSSV